MDGESTQFQPRLHSPHLLQLRLIPFLFSSSFRMQHDRLVDDDHMESRSAIAADETGEKQLRGVSCLRGV